MTPDLQNAAFQILSVIASAFGAYAAIRADLAKLQARVDNIEKSVDRANDRIDDSIIRHNNRTT